MTSELILKENTSTAPAVHPSHIHLRAQLDGSVDVYGKNGLLGTLPATLAQILAILHPITYTATAVAADILAIPITHRSVNKTTGADGEALTLANGAYLGQRLSINLVTDGGGDGTLTPATASGFASIVLADAGDFVDLEWTTAGWRIVGIGGASAQPAVNLS